MLATLRQRDFALLWFGGLISMTGSWVLAAALPFYIYDRTGSVLASAALAAAYLVPIVLLESVAGVFVDRWDRRRILIVTNLVRAGLLLLLLPVQSDAWLGLVYAVTVGESVLARFSGPAESALLPRLVAPERLAPANALNALNDSTARLLGPLLGGVLIGTVGLPALVLTDSACFLAAGALVALIGQRHVAVRPPAPGAAATAWAGWWREWLAGLRLIGHTRPLVVLFATSATAGLANSLLSALSPPFVKDILRGDAALYGVLLSVEAVSGLLGGLIVGRLAGVVPPARLAAAGLALAGVINLAIFNFPYLPVVLGLSLLVVIPIVAWSVSQATLVQTHTADRYLGRVFGALNASTALLRMVGAGVGGVLADRLGILPLLNTVGCLYILAGAIALVLLPGARCRPDPSVRANASTGR